MPSLWLAVTQNQYRRKPVGRTPHTSCHVTHLIDIDTPDIYSFQRICPYWNKAYLHLCALIDREKIP